MEQRFLDKVEKTGSCWLWTGCIIQNGYGQFKGKTKTEYAHRWSYEHYVGPIPHGLQIDHLCRVRHCVNPDHLEAVTPKKNTLRSPIAITAVNARKTHCVHGHPFTKRNTYEPPSRPGRRHCLACYAIKRGRPVVTV